MVNIDFIEDYYEITVTLPNNAFNKELLRKLFGLSMQSGNNVSSIVKSKNLNDLFKRVENFLLVAKILL